MTNPEALAHFFGPGGPLAAALPQFEERPQQAAIAQAVARTLHQGDKLVAEAGTGTGKTLAYLAPALAHGGTVVVSTATKNLQEQILRKDLPVLEAAVGRQFHAILLKGRKNYLCEAAYLQATRQDSLLADDHSEALDRIVTWRNKTQSGDRAELTDLDENHRVWDQVSVHGDACSGSHCPEFNRCWVTRVREQARSCQLIVVNHHLYCAHLAKGGSGILPPHDLVIFDEAHDLDSTATSNFGFEISEQRVQQLVRDIGRAHPSERVISLGERLPIRFRQLLDRLPSNGPRTTLLPGHVHGRVLERHARVEGLLSELDLVLQQFDGDPSLRRRVGELANELSFLLYGGDRSLPEVAADVLPQGLSPTDDTYVRYLEVFGGRRTLVARPLAVGSILKNALEQRPAVFLSATLAVGDSFDHYKERVGMSAAEEVIAASDFDYGRQAALYLPDDLPLPDSPSFSAAAAQRSLDLVRAAGGGAFVLCTSRRMLDLVSQRMGDTDLEVFTQGEAPRTHLLERFTAAGNGVLVATLSFWSGVDVPGDALRLVVIDKLPFASPGDPLLQARLDWLKARGQSPFGSYQLPQAALLLRQGFGRLIRSRSDRGLVAILDGRITQRGYGKKLLRSLPECPRFEQLNAARSYLLELGHGSQSTEVATS